MAPSPTKKWVNFLIDQGGHTTLMTIPAMAWIVILISRSIWLRRNKTPHNYGRTWWIYWPTQLFIFSASVCLLGVWYLLATGPYIASADGLLMGSFLSMISLYTAMRLNRNEHRYEIRSSDYLFIYYTSSLLGGALSLFILLEEVLFHKSSDTDSFVMDPPPVSDYKMDPLRFMMYYLGFVALALFFEMLPRSCTRVQKESRKKENLSSYDQANLFSRVIFHYSQPMMSLGARKTLTIEDLKEPTPPVLKTHVNYEIVSKTWETRVARYDRRNPKAKSGTKKGKSIRGPSLLLAVLSSYKWRIIPAMMIRLLSFALMYVPIFLFSYLLQFFTDYGEALKNETPPPAKLDGVLVAVGIFLGNVFSAVFLSISSNECTFMGIEARAALIAMIYRKSLKLSPASRSKSTLGEISSHMAVDAEVWMQATNLLPLVLTIPLELTISGFLLYRLLGNSFVAGLAVFLIISPIQAKMASLLHSYQRKKLKAMDSRLRLITEILSSIKIVKLQAWERVFKSKITILRNNELAAQKALATVRSLLDIVFSSVNLMILLATFTVYSKWGGPDYTPAKITPEIVFVGITLFTMMGRPLGLIPLSISHLTALRNANGRIRAFLLLEEIDPKIVEKYGRQDSSKDPILGFDGNVLAVEIIDGTFRWESLANEADTLPSIQLTPAQAERQPLLAASSSIPSYLSNSGSRPTLSNINLQIPEGQLTTIVGRIGQGKSSLLSAIIGEMYKQSGKVRVYGDLAYVPQQAWIINASVRDNIVFGKQFDQEKYDRVIFAAGLIPDLELLPDGDNTEIGEKGINLSGGQKQRVSLARAAYQDADIYLLDDPLSAVDAHVDQHLWNFLIGPEGLLRHKTRILVTHGIHHLNEVDRIVVIKDGMVSEIGKYSELMGAKKAFYQFILEYSVQEKKKDSTSKDIIGEKSDSAVKDSNGIVAKSETLLKDKVPKGKLVSAEKVEVGKVEWRVYLEYAKAISILNALFTLILYGLAQAVQVATNFWLRYWVTAEEREDERPVSFFLIGYAVIVGAFLLVDVSNSFMANVVCGIRGARVLFNQLLDRVLRMPMSFFDTTPMGRVINRFSTDISAVDTQIPDSLPNLLRFISTALTIVVVIAFSTPDFLYAIPPLAIVFLIIQNYYVKTSGQLKRLQSVSKSPLYQHFSETLAGVSTIRCQGDLVEQFILENEKRSDANIHTTNLFNLTNRWLTIRIQALCATTVFITATLAVLNADILDPSLVGLALSYALNLTNVINVLVRFLSDVQNQFVSVERIREYTLMPTEAPLKTGVVLPENWPDQGKITFKNFSARYREGLDLCIKNASFTIEPEEKVGIVGRTGAGKSSVTLALFRIIEAANSYWARASDPSSANRSVVEDLSDDNTVGSIEIDGIDISTLGLEDLRHHLSIIPQEATLFAGSVRDNLDPFHEVEDADLWGALERAHLKEYVSTLAGGLSFEISQNGENFSMGQRSLICLARALIRKTKILVLDEATAAVDVETDELIQRTIRTEFKNRTILTVAHRIKTVMDSDKILVMESGSVKEFDEPKSLIKRREGSLFYKLAEQAGEI